MRQHAIVVENGELTAIYADALLPYIESIKAEFGLPAAAVTMRRATHVEPDTSHRNGGNWYVDLTPCDGDRYFADEQGNPFITRSHALDFELRWLRKNYLGMEVKDVGLIAQEK